MANQRGYSHYSAQMEDSGSTVGGHGGRAYAYQPAAALDNPFADQSIRSGAHAHLPQMTTARQTPARVDGEKPGNIDDFALKASPSVVAGGTGGEGNMHKGGHEHVEDLETTASRRLWVAATWMLTFCIPSPLLGVCGRMKRPDVRMAWREKVAICILIVFMWAILLFAIIGLGLILCPKEYVWTLDNVAGHDAPDDTLVALRGTVYDVTDFMKQNHGTSAYTSTQDLIHEFFAGRDINASFPIPARVACPQFVSAKDDPNYLFVYPVQGASDIDPNDQLMFQHTMNRDPTSKKLQDPNFFAKYALPTLKNFKKGGVVWSFDWIESMYKDQSKYWRVINQEVFNMQPYFDAAKSGMNTNKKYNILDSRVEGIMSQNGFGTADITNDWNALGWDAATRDSNYNCMKNLFYVGKVDDRHS
ncbi:hypothetical protein IWQ57_005349, partial [Coemansia nantahalensis]